MQRIRIQQTLDPDTERAIPKFRDPDHTVDTLHLASDAPKFHSFDCSACGKQFEEPHIKLATINEPQRANTIEATHAAIWRVRLQQYGIRHFLKNHLRDCVKEVNIPHELIVRINRLKHREAKEGTHTEYAEIRNQLVRFFDSFSK